MYTFWTMKWQDFQGPPFPMARVIDLPPPSGEGTVRSVFTSYRLLPLPTPSGTMCIYFVPPPPPFDGGHWMGWALKIEIIQKPTVIFKVHKIRIRYTKFLSTLFELPYQIMLTLSLRFFCNHMKNVFLVRNFEADSDIPVAKFLVPDQGIQSTLAAQGCRTGTPCRLHRLACQYDIATPQPASSTQVRD